MAFPGDGRIVDPTGDILAAGSGEAGAIIATIERRKIRTVRRILPIERDQRPSVYQRLFEEVQPSVWERSREATDADESLDDES
jgi:hypothetical protein